MRFSTKVVVARPRQRVLELLSHPDYLSQWQSSVTSIELLTGERDQPGARSRVVFETRGIRLEMIETVVKRQLPDVFSSKFEARGVRNYVENRFYEDGPEQTRWVIDNTFEFSGLMSVVAVFVRDIAAKQTLESMSRFKAFAERVDGPGAIGSNGGSSC